MPRAFTFALNRLDFYFEFYVLCEEGISYLTLLFPETNNSLKKGTVVNFLFDNDTVLSYEIDKVNKLRFDNDNKIYNLEAKVKLRDFDTKTFAENRIVKWRITTENSLREGSITNEESQKNVMQLFNFYRNTYNETVGLNTLENYTETKKPEKCFVYLMHDTSNDMHKIGVSNSPDYREKTLQSEKPTIELLSSKPFVNRKIAMILEKSLHENYSENRIRGEWFDLTTIQINEIKEMLS